MILDNADNVDVFYPGQDDGPTQPPLTSFLPNGNGKIVITSRNTDTSERLTGDHKNIFTVLAIDKG